MAYVLDGILVVLFVLLVWLGHRRGFIKTVAGVVAFVVALMLSSMLAGPVSGFVYDTIVEPPLQKTLVAQIGEGSPAAETLDGVLEQLPAFVINRLEANGLNSGAAILNHIGNDPAAGTVDQRILDRVVEPVVRPLLKSACMLILFIVLLIVLTVLLKMLDVIARLPLLKQLNKLLGVVAGVAQGLLWVFFAVSVLQLLANLGWIDVLTPALLEETILIRRIHAVNPMTSALRELIVF